MAVRAILLRNSIDLFIARHMALGKEERNLSEFVLTSDDWRYCAEVNAFIKPLYLLVKELEGKSESGKLASLYFTLYYNSIVLTIN
jgi:hypothetical protein